MKLSSSLLLPVVLLAMGASNAGAAVSLAWDATYVQNFDSLANTGTTGSAMPTDWLFVETGTGANATYGVGTGSSNTGNAYSFGSTNATDRALGGLQSGSVVPYVGASFVNNVGGPSIDVTITYTGEQWRLGTTGREDRIDFQYSTDASSLTVGTWLDLNALDFIAPVVTGTLGALDGNASANRTAGITATLTGLSVAKGGTFWIRWSDFNATSSDDGLAVDDFTIKAVPETSAAALGALGLLGLLRRRR